MKKILLAILLTAIFVMSLALCVSAADVTESAEHVTMGDVDGDGDVTNADVLAIYRYIYNSEIYPLSVNLADVDGDGDVTNADVLAIYRYIYNPALYPLSKPTPIGLDFTSNGDGTCYVSGIGTCTDTHVVIPSKSPAGDTVTSIGEKAFSRCATLETILIPECVTSVDYMAFSHCTSLKTVDFVNSGALSFIGGYAFFGSTSLETINFSGTVEAWLEIEKEDGWNINTGNFAVYCTDGKVYKNGNVHYAGSEGLAYLSNGDGTCSVFGIGTCTDTEVVIPEKSPTGDTVTEIRSMAFSKCDAIVSVKIPSGVTTVGTYAFSECTALESVEIPDSVNSIGECAFIDCHSLVEVNIPGLVTSIGERAFSYCTSLASITIHSGVTDIDAQAFSYCTSLKSVIFEENSKLESIGVWAFYGCSALLGIEIPADVSAVGASAFYGCSSLESVTFAENSKLTEIGNSAFSDCTLLESIAVPAGVTTIGKYVFWECSSLESITFAENNKLTTIDEWAFYMCTSLKSIKIPAGVTRLGNNVLEGCMGLTSVVFEDPDNWYIEGDETNTSVYLGYDSINVELLTKWVYRDNVWYKK